MNNDPFLLRRASFWLVAGLFAVLPMFCASSFELVYTDHNLVDLVISEMNPSVPSLAETPKNSSGKGAIINRRVALFRNNVLIHTAQYSVGDWVFYSEGVTRNNAYVYTAKYYAWDDDAGQWVYSRTDGPVTADTSRCSGYLYNGTNSPFSRAPVEWNGDVQVGSVNVVDGVLNIHPGSTVTLHRNLNVGDQHFYYIPEGGEICASGTTFKSDGNDYGLFISTRGAASVSPTVHDCVFDGVYLYVAWYAERIDVVDNVFTAPLHNLWVQVR